MMLLAALLACGPKPCDELTFEECAPRGDCMRGQARDPCTGDFVYGGCAPAGPIADGGHQLLLSFDGECLVYDYGNNPSGLEECTSACVDTATYGR